MTLPELKACLRMGVTVYYKPDSAQVTNFPVSNDEMQDNSLYCPKWEVPRRDAHGVIKRDLTPGDFAWMESHVDSMTTEKPKIWEEYEQQCRTSN
jgi:hypothetical protein